MKNWIQKFMMGRYGLDQLSNAMFILSIVVILGSVLLKNDVLNTAGIIILLLSYLRMFSRNTSARYKENQKFMSLFGNMKRRAKGYSDTAKNKSQYKYFKCPSCGQKLRVPKGKGRVSINCPKCRQTFIRKA